MVRNRNRPGLPPAAGEVGTPADVEPVYDERGNVRPHGTEGARPMTYAERVKIAEKLQKG